MDSLMPILAVTPPSLIFFIFSAVLFLKWRSKRNRQTLYFATAFLLMGLCFGMWVLRTLFYPPSVDDPSHVVIFFKLAYVFGVPSMAFIGLTAIEMINPALISETRKRGYFFAPAVFLVLLITVIANPIPTTISEQADFRFPAEVSFAGSLVGLFYFIFPNYLFIWWLRNNKNHRLYSKMLIIEIGLLVFCAAIIIDGSKFAGMESFGTLIRWATALGAFIMIYGYLKK